MEVSRLKHTELDNNKNINDDANKKNIKVLNRLIS